MEMQKILKLERNPAHRICKNHFSPDDFITYKRSKLNAQATPTIISKGCIAKQIVPKEGCWVVGCNVKTKKRLVKIPHDDAIRKKWISSLQLTNNIEDKVLRELMICHKHFREDDWSLVTTKYFKSTAVPRRAIGAKIKKPLHKAKIYVHSSCNDDNVTPEHGYSFPFTLPRSRTMCFVTGCTAKAGNGIKLHMFPFNDRNVCKQWKHAIRRVTTPTKYSRVCSRHFLPSDYRAGGNRLKPSAIPSKHLPSPRTTHDIKLSKIVRVSCRRRFNHDLSPSGIRDDLRSFRDFSGNGDRELKEHSSTLDGFLANNASDADRNSFALNATCSSSNPTLNDGQIYADAYGEISHVHNSNEQDKIYIDVQYQQDDPVLHYNPIDFIEQAREKNFKFSKQATLTNLIKSDRDASVWTRVASLKQLDAICISVKALEDQVYQKRFKAHVVDRVILTLSKLKQNISFSAL
ncbi:uncharacterized protein LOC129718183 [Wyeomyia smithii]|uniref:uncharacterized protein LOC129718183 n=1 Tax=Wyeomyia smithii TaxID=174621 RepID=UPI002468001E|nr:uncharacterized protein LOC129718183 [Wyeomyia smithii]